MAGHSSHSAPPDYYAILSVSRDATQQEISRAWRKKVLLHHPDKQVDARGSTAPSQNSRDGGDIRLVNEAKWILSDEDRRKAWEEVFYSTTTIGGIPAPIVNTTPHISLHISLSQFTPHYTSAPTVAAKAEGSSPPSTNPEVDLGINTNAPGLGARQSLDADVADQQEGEIIQPGIDDIEPSYYTYPCRCSSAFVITYQDLEDGVDVIGCEGCGTWIRVGYEAVEEDEADDA